MTPTLLGRWQTRAWLTIFIGGVFTLAYWSILGFQAYIQSNDLTLFSVLLTVMLLGFVWDVIYDFVLRFRWDHDWPPVFQLISGIWEYFITWWILAAGLIPFTMIPSLDTWWIFHSHYWLIWFATFIASQGFLRILEPRWRISGWAIWKILVKSNTMKRGSKEPND